MTPKHTTTKPLRFAPIIRVSTERQEQQGESLRTQTIQIKQAVATLGGTIPSYCWKYSGQEHATVSYEREKLDQLLKDSREGLFDAVIVVDPSRWSRDNIRNETGLNTLRDAGVRFYVGSMEYNLRDPNQRMFLALNAVMNQQQAIVQKKKSMESKIERSRRGIPCIGKLPYARTFDHEALKAGKPPHLCWGLDEEKAGLFRHCAERYANGESPYVLAKLCGMTHPNFSNTMQHRSGPTWTVHFEDEDLGIQETIHVPVPRLLSDELIERIRERVRVNMTGVRGHRVHRYLLASYIYCARCGYMMRGCTNQKRHRYYAHATRRVKRPCDFRRWIRADELESAVLVALVRTVGNPLELEIALQRNIPDAQRREELKSQRVGREKALQEVSKAVGRLMHQAEIGVYDRRETELKQKMQELDEREASLKEAMVIIDHQLERIPDPESIKAMSKLGRAILSDAKKHPHTALKKSWEWRRSLLEHAFSGKDTGGRPLGIYVDHDKEGNVSFEIRGRFGTEHLPSPLTDEYIADVFGLDSSYHNIHEEAQKIREYLSNKVGEGY